MQLLDRHHVTLSGSEHGRPLVFAHGFGCDQRMWRLVAPAFEDDHRVVLFDHAGAGRSDPSGFDPDRHATLDGYAQDVVALLEALDLQEAVFVGHSVSAMIGALASRQAPERFAGLVMVGPSPRYLDTDGYRGGFSRADIDELLDTMDRNYLGWAHSMAGVVAGDRESDVAQELDNSFCRTDPDIARPFARTTFLSDNRADLPHVPCPTLVVQVRQDAIAPIEVGEYVAATVPEADLVLIDSVGHCPHLSDPAATIRAIRGFL